MGVPESFRFKLWRTGIRFFCSGTPTDWMRHNLSCLAAGICFIEFKEPGSFKNTNKHCAVHPLSKIYRWIPLKTPQTSRWTIRLITKIRVIGPVLWIRITFMRIRIQLFTQMLIQILLFTLMRIRILHFAIIRIRIWLSKIMQIHADPDPQHCERYLQFYFPIILLHLV